ncbi:MULTISPECIES: hypothetical protein [unclassified Sinorhizobium]|uniref:hypothetical protein n=1 Tax=unclassified Sinorhizobium TaxID=2613772 RepID=UPI0024C2A7B0|nr:MULTISPECIES: hypothetical protein [unclassified Sinorhizobium]MDK1378685.1 hypothetical protein [Sinorhizobium sp. 6-70]MDK1480753.1 hypothetical protein [Sinorhizobium sp. 6-117]
MSDTSRGRVGRTSLALGIAFGVAFVATANAHLVYVAVTSQPDCVPHRRVGEASTQATFAAAQSECRNASETDRE